MLKNLKKLKGFTLIEVVIVLAIAALIILIVLQAVAAAQRTRRDTTRKSDGGRISSLLEEYASNNSGVYPSGVSPAPTPLAAVTTYDSALGAKIKSITIVTTQPTNGAACTATSGDEDYYIYFTSTTYRAYSLYTCLEAGGYATIKAAK